MNLTFAHGSPVVPLNRENDSRPFIGGDYLLGWDGSEWVACTAGIPVEDSHGTDYLITANHCFQSGNNIYTKNYGHHVGLQTSWDNRTDSELINTGYANGGGRTLMRASQMSETESITFRWTARIPPGPWGKTSARTGFIRMTTATGYRATCTPRESLSRTSAEQMVPAMMCRK